MRYKVQARRAERRDRRGHEASAQTQSGMPWNRTPEEISHSSNYQPSQKLVLGKEAAT